MAVITGSTPGGSVMTAAGVHAYMQSLRGYLLSVGMEELPIPGAYDASPEGDVSQVPEGPSTSNLFSSWMHFAFTDGRQSGAPIVVSFRASRGAYFRSGSSGGDLSYPRYIIGVRVSQGVSPEGEAIGATVEFGTIGGSSTTGGRQLSDAPTYGDFVRYSGESLTIFLGLFSQDNAAGRGSAVQLHVERTAGADFAALGRTYGHVSAVQAVHYSSGSNMSSSAGLQGRAGGTLGYYDSGSAVVAPVFSQTSLGRITPLTNVFTVPEDIAQTGSILELDFSGEPKNYLLVRASAMQAYESGTAWLYQWE